MADYPISPVVRRVVYTASAGVGPYAFTFEVLTETDIDVYVDSTLKTLTTDYTVTINANGTGSITFVTAPTSTARVTIVGAREIQRATDFVTGGDLTASSLNLALDQNVIFAQQNAEAIGRAIIAPVTDPTSINMVLPLSTVRANKTLAFDSDGNPIIGEQIGDWKGNWASGQVYAKRDLIKDTTNSNVYICVVAHTSSGALPITTNADSAKWSLVVDAAAAAAAQAAAEAAQAAAEAAQTAAELAETNAETAETNAETAETNAAASASAASTSATNASNSATAAASSASTASTAATNAASSASAASTSASNAASSASAASTSASNAASSASAASTSASNAATSATNAANSATAAQTAQTAAETAETNAETAQTAAEAAQTAAEAALAAFNAVYLGAQSSDPSLDNEGDPVTAGDWYFNTSSNRARIYDGAAWDFVSVDPATVVGKTSVTGSAALPAGTEAQRDGSPGAGYLRFNTDTDSFEGYNGTAWGGIGGAQAGGAIVTNKDVASVSYTIAAGENGLSVGPITVDTGVTITVSSGQRWLVL
jgi:hypothetical protein